MRKETNMSKKLKIQFWRAKLALAMQILEQEGLPKEKTKGDVRIAGSPELRYDFVFLRGDYIPGNSNIGWITFNTQYDLNTYLHWAVNAITDELFTGEGELKIGEMCEVRDGEAEQWKKRKLLAILPKKYKCRYITEAGYQDTVYAGWDCARPIAKRTEPTIEECGNVVTYTWEEIKEEHQKLEATISDLKRENALLKDGKSHVMDVKLSPKFIKLIIRAVNSEVENLKKELRFTIEEIDFIKKAISMAILDCETNPPKPSDENLKLLWSIKSKCDGLLKTRKD